MAETLAFFHNSEIGNIVYQVYLDKSFVSGSVFLPKKLAFTDTFFMKLKQNHQ